MVISMTGAAMLNVQQYYHCLKKVKANCANKGDWYCIEVIFFAVIRKSLLKLIKFIFFTFPFSIRYAKVELN
jgi:hypothetical protein